MRNTLVMPLKSIFSCNFMAMEKRMFTGGFIRMPFTRKLMFSAKSFRNCNRQRSIQTLTKCLAPLVEKCHQSDIVAIKTIRLHMSFVDQLMSRDPDLRVIHVVRDPRGLLESWRRLHPKARIYTSPIQTHLNAKLICQRMMTDCQIRRQLELKYPRRILLLRYEDLATDTDTVLRKVYNGLLQLPSPSKVVDGVKQQLTASSANGPMGTQRSNGAATATNWRNTINSQLLEDITDTCHQLMAELHYY